MIWILPLRYYSFISIYTNSKESCLSSVLYPTHVTNPLGNSFSLVNADLKLILNESQKWEATVKSCVGSLQYGQ